MTADTRADDAPRWERRAWAAEFPDLPDPAGEPESEEIYLLPPHPSGINVKVRGDTLESKELLTAAHGLQLWRRAGSVRFPAEGSLLTDELWRRLGVALPLVGRVSRAEFVAKLGERPRRLATARVHKRRRLFEIGGCRAEVCRVRLAGRIIATAAIEEASAERAATAARLLGLHRWRNLDYVSALLDARLPWRPICG